jgi:hypothetical protein
MVYLYYKNDENLGGFKDEIEEVNVRRANLVLKVSLAL